MADFGRVFGLFARAISKAVYRRLSSREMKRYIVGECKAWDFTFSSPSVFEFSSFKSLCLQVFFIFDITYRGQLEEHTEPQSSSKCN